jgi:hypothetical protein
MDLGTILASHISPKSLDEGVAASLQTPKQKGAHPQMYLSDERKWSLLLTEILELFAMGSLNRAFFPYLRPQKGGGERGWKDVHMM